MEKIKRSQIDAKFSKIVGDYLSRGWTLNTHSMSGSQGELAHVHLLSPDKKLIHNMYIEQHYFNYDFPYIHHSLSIIIKELSTKSEFNWIKYVDDGYTVWNKDGTKILEETYYQVGDANKVSCRIYTDEAGAKEVNDLRHKRFYLNNNMECSTVNLSSKANEKVLSFVRRQPRCKGKKLSDIHAVTHDTKNNIYRVELINGTVFRMS